MKIGVVSVIHEPWGGSEELWAQMAQHALADGHQVVHSTLRFPALHPKENALIGRGLKVVTRRGYVTPGVAAWKRMATKAVNLGLDKVSNPFASFFSEQPNIVLYNCTSFSILDQWPLAAQLFSSRTPYVILSHLNTENNRVISYADTLRLKRFYAEASGIWFVSQRTRIVTERHLAMDMGDEPIVINPVNMEVVDPIPYPSISGSVHFALVGNLVVCHKGQDVMLEVLSSDHWRSKPWHLNIYGSGMDEQYLNDLVKHYQLQEKVTFHGRVQDIRSIWTTNHMLLMPSVMEGMPLAVVEAMLCARPVLVTDVGGHAEWIEDGTEGFMAEACSRLSIDHALQRAWDRRSDWPQMGMQAHQTAIANYDPNAGRHLLNRIIEKSKTN